MAVRITPTMAEMIQRLADRAEVPHREASDVFLQFWNDMAHIVSTKMCFAVDFKKFGSFHLLMFRAKNHVTAVVNYLVYKYNREREQRGLSHEEALNLEPIKAKITELIIELATIKHYEKEVLSSYPKKYKADMEAIQADIHRLEKSLNIQTATWVLSISNPIQKIYVQKLRKLRLLPNLSKIEDTRKSSLYYSKLDKNKKV